MTHEAPKAVAPGTVVEPAADGAAASMTPAPESVFGEPTAVYEVLPDAPARPPDQAHAIAGEVAVDVARQLAEPVRALRDRLGLVVDHLERHVASSTGPTPYPWRSLQALRQDLAAGYLEATSLARRLDELDRALAIEPAGWFDLSVAVELGLHLAGHHLAAGIELLIDLGNTPLARGTPGTVALLVAQLVAVSASSARDLPGSSLSVRVASDGAWALVMIADNGAGSARVAGLGELIRGVLAPWGGTIDAASVAGAGCAFEVRLMTSSG